MSANSVEVQYTETTGKLRVYYNKPNGYKNRAEFDAIVEAMWITGSMVQLQAGKGELTKRALLKIAQRLYDKGAERVIVQRARGKGMPWGTLTHSDGVEDTYLVNLLEMRHRGLIHG